MPTALSVPAGERSNWKTAANAELEINKQPANNGPRIPFISIRLRIFIIFAFPESSSIQFEVPVSAQFISSTMPEDARRFPDLCVGKALRFVGRENKGAGCSFAAGPTVPWSYGPVFRQTVNPIAAFR